MKYEIFVAIALIFLNSIYGAPNSESSTAKILQNTTEEKGHFNTTSTTRGMKKEGEISHEGPTTTKDSINVQQPKRTTTSVSKTSGKLNTTTFRNQKKKNVNNKTEKTQKNNHGVQRPKIVEEGSILVFRGICGDLGCAIEGDMLA